MRKEFEILLGIAFRLRIVLAAVAVAAAVLFLGTLAEGFNTVKMDYLAWAMFSAIFLVSASELWRFGRDYGPSSTLTLDLVALGLAVFGRFSSVASSMWTSGLTFSLVGGGIVGEGAVYLAAWLLPASMICLWATIVHTVARRPPSFITSVTYSELLGSAVSFASKVWGSICRHPVAFSFAIAFGVRLIPELIWWPWPIGWDTVYYISNLDSFLANPNPFAPQYIYGHYRNTPPMLDIVLSVPALFIGSWMTYKVYPPVAYGLMAALVAWVSIRALRMDGKYAIFSSLLSALFILNLRISWDYQKQMMGTLFLLAFLAVSDRAASAWRRRDGVLAGILLVGSALSSEVTALASFLASGYLFARHAYSRKGFEAATYAAVLCCSTSLLLWYSGKPVYPNAYLGSAPVGLVANFSDTSQVFPYFIVGFGAVLPLAAAGLRRTNGAYRAVFLGLILAAVSPLVMPYTSVTTWYRFLIQLAPLSVPLAAFAVSKKDSRAAAIALALLIVVPGVAFLSPTGSRYTTQITASIREFPSAMAPAPASTSQLEALLEAGQKAAGYVENGSIPVIARTDDSRFIYLFVRDQDPAKLIPLWTVDGTNVNRTMGRLGVDKVLIMTTMSAKSLESSLSTISEYGSIIYEGWMPFNITPVWKGGKGGYIYLVAYASSG
ncbi:MAG: hypothetical protein WHS82_01260 [Candidatus Methanosuratincola sp.]